MSDSLTYRPSAACDAKQASSITEYPRDADLRDGHPDHVNDFTPEIPGAFAAKAGVSLNFKITNPLTLPVDPHINAPLSPTA
jgi:hypothetical protein